MPLRPGLVGLLLLAALGCGEAAPPPLVAVNGQVTFRGVPLPGGLIVFTPDDESGFHGACALGSIGPDGRYTLSTEGKPGVTPGRHRVTVAGPDLPGWGVPERFRDPQLSELRAEIIPGRDNALDFHLQGP